MHLGEEGTEQFTVVTELNGEKIGEQQIHDPFIRSTIKLRGLRHAWNALTKGLHVTVSVDGSHGAMRAIMTLDPNTLEADSVLFLEQQRLRRESPDAFIGQAYNCTKVAPPSQKEKP